MEIKVGMVSLGCPKNQVDGEMLLSTIATNRQYILTNEIDLAEIIIINTCGFIEQAKKESIDTILEFCALKEKGTLKKVVVSGCLAERYQEELKKEIPEVDAVIGIGSNKDILLALDTIWSGEDFIQFGKKSELSLNQPRILTTPKHYAYLKIAEGCDNGCTFCAIPLIRGRFRSRPMEEIITEAKQLAAMGVKEFMVIAQDTTRYGEDLYGKQSLPQLLRELCQIPEIVWVRIMYCYPERMDDALLEVMAKEDKIVKYLELPIQHCDGTVLNNMRRHGDVTWMRNLITHIRTKVPNIAIRTTLITGFPGETEAQFATLQEFVKDMKFERLGCFAYSKEEDTLAYKMENQLSEECKQKRAELITNDQIFIMEKINQSRISTKQLVLLEEKTDTGYLGRSQFDAPEIDGGVILTTEKELPLGSFVQVTITEADQFDLYGIL